MRTLLTLAVFSALVPACGEPCDTQLATFTPADGATPAGRTTPIRVMFTGTSENVAFDVTGPGGPINGTTTTENGVATFTPNAPYPENTEIQWSLSACDAFASGSFSTGTLETSLSSDDLAGSTYSVDLANATWVSPSNGGALISQVFGGVFLIGIQSAQSNELDCIGAAGEATAGGSWQQDPCFPTIDFDSVDFSTNPYFALHTPLLEFAVQGMSAKIHDVAITGGLTDEALTEGGFSGEVDLRDYTAALGSNGCSTIALVGLSCTACRSDDELQCIWLEAVDVDGERVGGLSLQPNENPEECSSAS